jgi:hypothetical protein
VQTRTVSELVEEARERVVEAVQAPAAPALPDPLVRPVVPPEAAQGPVPEYTPEELAELVRLIHPLRVYDNDAGRWRTVDTSLPALRHARHEYLSDLQDRADRVWRSSGAYAQAVDRAAAAGREVAADRAYEREREARREALSSKRVSELVEYGLSPREAQAQVAREFPDV